MNQSYQKFKMKKFMEWINERRKIKWQCCRGELDNDNEDTGKKEEDDKIIIVTVTTTILQQQERRLYDKKGGYDIFPWINSRY